MKLIALAGLVFLFFFVFFLVVGCLSSQIDPCVCQSTACSCKTTGQFCGAGALFGLVAGIIGAIACMVIINIKAKQRKREEAVKQLQKM